MRWVAVITLAACAAGIALAAVPSDPQRHDAPAVRSHAGSPRPTPAPLRPPQFIVASFDGAGGGQMWAYWRSVAQRAHAHFTFFVSGTYLVDWAHRTRYRPPRHEAGDSAIGFALPTGDLTVARTLRGIVEGYRAGHEIATHFNGHFCGPGGVSDWTAADWRSELDQFYALLFHAGRRLPFGRGESVGDRTPCLEGNLSVLYPVLKRLGFRYDASRLAPLGRWPVRKLGLWSFPLLEIPFVGHTFRVVSMDYNFFANQTSLTPARVESQTYRSLWNAFRAGYLGNRAPLSIGQHFETWESWAYDHALTRVLLTACRLPEVRCVSFRRLADFLDSVPPARLRRYRTGRFPHLHTAGAPEPKLNLFSTRTIERLKQWSAAVSK
jgi:peptidoglycan/xylan/chitin deacetylase (PgdA/CDA1 family)